MNLEEFRNSIKENIQENKILHSYMYYGENIEMYYDEILLFLYNIATINIEQEEKKKKIIEQIKNGTIEEFQIIDGKESKVADIRKTFKTINEKPLIINKRIYLINNFEYLNNNSQNALLKILEEPPLYVTIVITSKTLNNILDTIKSRCRKIYLAEKDQDYIEQVLEQSLVVDILQDAQKMKKTAFYEKYNNIITKENISKIIIEIEILVYEKILIYSKISKILNEINQKLKMNSNFEMTKDKLIFEIWDQIQRERGNN